MHRRIRALRMLAGSVLSDGRTVRLTWTPTMTSATGYRVYRSSSASGPWTLVDTVAGRTSATVDQSSPDGTWHDGGTRARSRVHFAG